MLRFTANRRLSSDSHAVSHLSGDARALSIGAARCCDDAVVASRVARRRLPRCPRERTILGDWPTDNRAGGVANPAASEGGATPPGGADRDRAPGGARRSGGVAPPSLVRYPSFDLRRNPLDATARPRRETTARPWGRPDCAQIALP